jgi:hypothetical protein
MLQNINAYFSIKSVPQGKASFHVEMEIRKPLNLA